MTDLLDLLREAQHDVDARRDWVHACLPSMGYMCGGTILGLADGGPGGHMVLGASAADWPLVTCPTCRAPGRREVARICHRQQLRDLEHHQCNDACHWTRIGEDE
jgi:hypothetical protein